MRLKRRIFAPLALAVLLLGFLACSQTSVEPEAVSYVPMGLPLGDMTSTISASAGAPLVELNRDPYWMNFSPVALQFGDQSIQPKTILTNEEETEFHNLFGVGTHLHFRSEPGMLQHNLLIDQPMDLGGASHLEVVEVLNFEPGLQIWTQDGEVEIGKHTDTPAWISLRDATGREIFHIPASAVWDVNREDFAWSEYHIEFLAAGQLLLNTRIPSEWLNDPARVYPVTIDPTVRDEAPAPIIASLQVETTVPGGCTGLVSATYYNYVNDVLRVRINWGDGEHTVFNSNQPVYELHEYAEPGIYEVKFKVRDFNDPPQVTREFRDLVVCGYEDEGSDCGFVELDVWSDLDWADDCDDCESGEDNNGVGEALGFTFEIDGQSFTHFSVGSNGYVQLMNEGEEILAYGDYGDQSDWLDWYGEGSFVFALLDDLDPSEGEGFGYLLEEGKATFYWDCPTYYDEDDEFSSQFSVVLEESGLIHFNFGDSGWDGGHDHDLFTGLWLAETETLVEIQSGTVPENACWTFPGGGFISHPTISRKDIPLLRNKDLK